MSCLTYLVQFAQPSGSVPQLASWSGQNNLHVHSPCSREYKMITSCSYSKHYSSSLYCPQPHLHELHLLYISSRNGPTLKLVQKVLNFWTSVVTIPMFLIRNNWTHNWHIPPWTTNKLLTVIWEQQQTSWWQKNALLYLLIRTVHLFSLSCSQPLVSALG